MIDKAHYIEELKAIVNLDCGSFTPKGVTRVAEFIKEKFEPLGFSFQSIDVGNEVANLLVGKNCNEDTFDVIISGHMDTVFPEGTSAKIPLRVEGNYVYGAGVQDMKCGIINALYAFRLLGKETLSKLKIGLVFSPDEEISSRFSKEEIKKFSKGSKLALVVEASPNFQTLTRARKSIARYNITIKGKSAHSSRPQEGASAIKALGEIITKLYALQELDKGITVNIGTVKGGMGANTVPSDAELSFEMRHLSIDDFNTSQKAYDAIIKAEYEKDICVTSTLVSFKPPMEIVGDSQKYQDLITACMAELGYKAEYITGAGGSDGNYIASMGVPVIDAIGGVGKGAHSQNEYIELEETLKRVELLRNVILKLI